MNLTTSTVYSISPTLVTVPTNAEVSFIDGAELNAPVNVPLRELPVRVRVPVPLDIAELLNNSIFTVLPDSVICRLSPFEVTQRPVKGICAAVDERRPAKSARVLDCVILLGGDLSTVILAALRVFPSRANWNDHP